MFVSRFEQIRRFLQTRLHLLKKSLIENFILSAVHCVKSVRIRSYSGPYFPAFGLNKEIYSVPLRIHPNAGKYGTE